MKIILNINKISINKFKYVKIISWLFVFNTIFAHAQTSITCIDLFAQTNFTYFSDVFAQFVGENSSKQQYDLVINPDKSFDLLPLNPDSHEKVTRFTGLAGATNPYPTHGGPIIFGVNKEGEPLISPIIWNFLGISIHPITKAIHIPPIDIINSKLSSLEKITKKNIIKFSTHDITALEYVKNFSEELTIPFNEIIHDFFVHFSSIFENTEKLNKLRQTSSLLLKFFKYCESNNVSIDPSSYSFVKKQMLNYLIISIDNSIGYNLLNKDNDKFQNGIFLIPQTRNADNFATNFFLNYFQADYFDATQRLSPHDLIRFLLMHAVSYGLTYTPYINTSIERPDMLFDADKKMSLFGSVHYSNWEALKVYQIPNHFKTISNQLSHFLASDEAQFTMQNNNFNQIKSDDNIQEMMIKAINEL